MYINRQHSEFDVVCIHNLTVNLFYLNVKIYWSQHASIKQIPENIALSLFDISMMFNNDVILMKMAFDNNII